MAINFNIKTVNMDLTPAITSYINDKLGSIEKFLNPSPTETVIAQVEVGLRSRKHKKGDIYRAEINLEVSGNKYRAVVKKDNMHSAIDELRDEISKIVRSKKGRSKNLFRKGARKIKDLLRRGK